MAARDEGHVFERQASVMIHCGSFSPPASRGREPGIDDPRLYSVEELLRDGASIHIRAIRPDDRERLVEHFQGLSARSVYFRFFGAKRRLTDDELDRFTRLDFVERAALVANLKSAGFTGRIYPVNPQADEIQGLRAYPRIAAIGQPVDLAVVAVPAAAVEAVVEECASAGVRGVVVISSVSPD